MSKISRKFNYNKKYVVDTVGDDQPFNGIINKIHLTLRTNIIN